MITSWQQLGTSFLRQVQATKNSIILLAHLVNIEQKKGESLKSYINCFNKTLAFVMWSPDRGILAHLTNRVLPEILLWDKLQQKECRSVNEFYRKASKFLKLEDSKEALHKAEKASANKKNDLGETPDGSKNKDKRKGEDKRAKSPKKQRSGPSKNKGLLLKYTNYHSLIAPFDHIYGVIDGCLYRQPKAMKGDRS